MSDYATIIVHGIIFLFGLMGVSVSAIFMNLLLFVGSMITVCAVSYSFYTTLSECELMAPHPKGRGFK